jgi:hypothetical protein
VSYTLTTIVCLANSRKKSGRCIAGKEWANGRAGRWVRPVSERESHEISESDRQYQDGTDPRLLDVINIPFKKVAPSSHQPENYLIDDGYYWTKVGVASLVDVVKFADRPASLWKNGFSSGSGTNDRIPISEAIAGEGSLFLIWVTDLIIQVYKKSGPDFSKRVIRAQFTHQGEQYDLGVTDPIRERTYLAMSDGQHDVGKALLCVSLGDPFGEHYYKLVAAILT